MMNFFNRNGFEGSSGVQNSDTAMVSSTCQGMPGATMDIDPKKKQAGLWDL